MIPAQFDYVAPATIEEALEALSQHGDDAKLMAGGQSLLPVLRMRLNAPEMVIDLGKIDGLNGFAIAGTHDFERVGYAVSTAGDVNGDGFDDILIGDLGGDPYGSTSGSRACFTTVWAMRSATVGTPSKRWPPSFLAIATTLTGGGK